MSNASLLIIAFAILGISILSVIANIMLFYYTQTTLISRQSTDQTHGWGQLIIATLPLGLANAAGILSLHSNKFILGSYTTPETLAVYTASLTIVELMFMVANFLGLGMLSVLSAQLIHQNNKSSISIFPYLRMFLVPAVVFTILLLLFNHRIVSILFPDDYILAGRSLSILAAGLVPVFLNNFFSYVLISLHKYQLYFLIVTSALISNVVVTITTIGTYYELGAAYALVISETLALILFLISFLVYNKKNHTFTL
jgi:O-antigen/teichoic acid export membrane protein